MAALKSGLRERTRPVRVAGSDTATGGPQDTPSHGGGTMATSGGPQRLASAVVPV